MPHLAQKHRTQITATRTGIGDSKPFHGFAAPTSNTTYTPNQFFDVCLPNASRGAVRLVAYMIRRTLGWCDAQGNPQEERFAVSYQDLVTRAGISREMIRAALDEAIGRHFIRCIQPGHAKRQGATSQTALYELCWDGSAEYVKDPKRFRGFFEGEGNRTDIPNEFFDRLLPRESLAVIKAVGSIIRFSIGFQARRGVRRQHVQLSYSDIQRYARVRSRSTLGEALETAQRRNYVACLKPGVFDPNAGRLSRAAVYALKWADGFGQVAVQSIGQKSEPAQNQAISDHRSEFRTGDRSEKRTGIGQKTAPENRSEKRTGIEIKQRNETLKQQKALADAEIEDAWATLLKKGFDHKTARGMAERYPKERIERQIQWLPIRAPLRNPLGMLRRSIEEDWPNPEASEASLDSRGAVFASNFYAALAGNTGAPVAEPSARDTGAAERFIRKLAMVETGGLDPAHWGRAFGRMTAEDSPSLAKGGITLTLALRLRGDGFYLRHQDALHVGRVKAERAAREAHEALHRVEWIKYLIAEERRVKEERPCDYARFVEHRADERRRMIESPWAVFIEERLARYEGEARRVLDFQKFFAAEVLGFWEWDARMNLNPFTPTALSAQTPTPIMP